LDNIYTCIISYLITYDAKVHRIITYTYGPDNITKNCYYTKKGVTL